MFDTGFMSCILEKTNPQIRENMLEYGIQLLQETHNQPIGVQWNMSTK